MSLFYTPLNLATVVHMRIGKGPPTGTWEAYESPYPQQQQQQQRTILHPPVAIYYP